MKNILWIFLFLMSCAPIFAPSIDMYNLSHQKMKNIDGYVGRVRFAKGSDLNLGQSRGESYYINSKSDIFGSVHVEWENESGKKFSRNFTLDKSQIRYDWKNHYRYKNIIFFFYDNDVEMHIVQTWPDQYVIQKREARKAEALKNQIAK